MKNETTGNRPVPNSVTARFIRLTGLDRRATDTARLPYIPQTMNGTQFATLRALLRRLLPHAHPARLAAAFDENVACTPPPFDHQLGLDELNGISHTRTGFAFADLTPEVQDAFLGLIATRDLVALRVDLCQWLESLRTATLALQPA